MGAELEPDPVEGSPSLGMLFGILLWLLASMIGWLYSIPIRVALRSPILGLIFGFALWEAWRFNRRYVVTFNGPFPLGAANAGGPAPDVMDDAT